MITRRNLLRGSTAGLAAVAALHPVAATAATEVVVGSGGDAATIQGGLNLLRSSGATSLRVLPGTYREEAYGLTPLDQWPAITFEPGAVMDGGGRLTYGLHLTGRFRVYGAEARNYVRSGLVSGTHSEVEWYDCAASGCSEAGLCAEIQSRSLVFGGEFRRNRYGIRIYSCSVGSIRSGQTVYLEDNAVAGLIVREYSNVRADEFVADGNPVGVVIQNARAHIRHATFGNANVAVKWERGGSWLDDHNIYRKSVRRKYQGDMKMRLVA